MTDWRPLDLSAVLDGLAPEPTVLRRTDGRCLMYREQTHWVQGPPQSGKTWVALVAAAEVLASGGHVSWNDNVHTPLLVVSRLLKLGVARSMIERQFHYRADSTGVYMAVSETERPPDGYRLAGRAPSIDLLVIDGWGHHVHSGTMFTRKHGPQFGTLTTIVTEECRSGDMDGLYGDTPLPLPVYSRADVAYHCQTVTMGGPHTRLRLLKDRYGELRIGGPKHDYPAAGELWIRDTGWELTPGRESRLELAADLEQKVVGFLRVEPMDTEQLLRMLGSSRRATKEKVLKGLADDGKIVSRVNERNKAVWFAADDPQVQP